MATSTNAELESQLSLLRDINKEMSSFISATKEGMAYTQTMKSVEAKILEQLTGQSKHEEDLTKAKIKILGIEEQIARIMRRPKPLAGGALKNEIEKLIEAKQAHDKIMTKADKIRNIWTELGKQFGGIFGKLTKFSELIELAPEAALLASLIYTFKKIFDVFKQLDEAAADFRKSIGITRDSSREIESMARDIAISYMRLGVEAKDVYSSIKDIADALGSSQYATKGVVENMSIFSAQLGISTKTSTQFLKTMALVGRSTLDGQKNMLYFAQYMSSAAGVPLDAVMEDVAQASQESYQFLSRNPTELVKAAVEAKRMGTSLQSAAKTSSTLLNFTENVRAEMEASVLLGKGLNLQKARELAYHRDIRGLNNEILRIAQQTNFENLDPFQQDAVAKALGKSAGELATMVQSAREHQSLMAHMTEEQRKQYDIYEKALNANNLTKQSMEDQAKAQLQQMSNQAALKSISLAWNGIMANLGAVALPAIAFTLTLIAKILNGIIPISNDLVKAWFVGISFWKEIITLIKSTSIYAKTLGALFTSVGSKLSFWFNSLTKTGTVLGRIVGWAKSFGELIAKGASELAKLLSFGGKLGGIMGRIASFGAFFGRWLTPIGWIITAGIFIYNLFKRFSSIEFVKGDWIGNIWKGIKAVGEAIYDTLLKPFVEVFQWIWKHLAGHSPSEIGIGIVKGLQAVVGIIFNILISPYKSAWNVIKSLFSVNGKSVITTVGHMASQLGLMMVKGIVSVEGALIKALVSPFSKAWNFIKNLPIVSKLFHTAGVQKNINPLKPVEMTVNKPSPEVDTTKKTGAIANVVHETNDELTKIMSSVVDAINNLRTDMKNGAINANVYLDAQKLDAALGRKLKYTGALV